jgi:hydrogenase expression/formation protein HypD
VTEPGFIDALNEISQRPGHRVFAFGDMLRVPGSSLSLSGARAAGGRVSMFLGPHDVIEYAGRHPEETCTVAAVGFETTAPVYALLLQKAEKAGLANVRLVSALKTMIEPLRFLAAAQNGIDAFLCPGHVSVLIGSGAFEPLAEEFKKPFVIAGFEPQDILVGLNEILSQLESGRPRAANLYPRAVTREGNRPAMDAILKYFEPSDERWRGIGLIPGSGLRLRREYAQFDAWPGDLPRGVESPACRCGDVMLGRIVPNECPLFLRGCDPAHPVGACMVSAEGACGIWVSSLQSPIPAI